VEELRQRVEEQCHLLDQEIMQYLCSNLNFMIRFVTLLVGHQEGHPVCKKLSAGVVICLERGADDLLMVQMMPLPPHHLCFINV